MFRNTTEHIQLGSLLSHPEFSYEPLFFFFSLVPSVGQGARTEAPNLVFFWQLEGGAKQGGVREAYRWFGCVVLIVLAGTCKTYSHPCMKEIVQVPAILATRVMLSGGVLPWRWRRTSSFGRPAGLQHAHLVLRPIERSLRAAPGWGVLEVPGSKERRGPVFWKAGATAPAAVGSGQAKITCSTV